MASRRNSRVNNTVEHLDKCRGVMNNEVYTEEYKGLTINIMYQDQPQNPFEDWDCEPPLAVYSDRNITEYATRYGEVNSVPTLTREQIKANASAICDVCNVKSLRDLVREYRDNNGGVSDSDVIYMINYGIESIVDNNIWRNSDRLDVLCDLYNMAGMPAVCSDVRGSCQGDWAKVLAVATPEFQEACGNGSDFDWIESLKGSIQLFEDWAFGNVYGYEVLDAEGEHVDSCWGYYGDYDADYSALSEAKSAADYHIEQARKSHFEQVKTWIKNRVPLAYRVA